MKKIMELLQNMKAKNEKKDNKGFSLVELIIVIAIMAILVGIVGTQVLPYINKSKEAKDFQIINSYGTAATTAYSSDAENVTADTTIIVYGTNKDETGKPAATLENEIKTLTGYDAAAKLHDKMGSKKGKKINAVKVEISLTNKTITTQAYEDAACTKPVFDKVVTQL
ncbi:type II secretion system protein [Roseburia faecis]|uniref:type II secretion system protein n=1 Tax=Roseburia faecis TaxID=301302 RepID=UPI0031B59BF5